MGHIKSPTLHATFSATSNAWTIRTENEEFEVRYLKIVGRRVVPPDNSRLASHTQEIIAEDVVLELGKNQVKIISWRKMKKISHYRDLWDPDHPRNLSKVVTVR